MSRHLLTPADRLVIYGNGQMARMFLHFARRICPVTAFTVDRECIEAPEYLGVPVVPFDDIAAVAPPTGHCMIIAVGFARMNRLRAERYRDARRMGYRCPSFVDPSVILHEDVQFGDNNVVLDHVAIHPGTRLGDSNFVCSNSTIGHGCRLGDNCWINSGVSVAGEVSLGDNCFLGVGATLGDNIALAERSFVGANALLARNTVAGEVVIAAQGERFPLSSDDFLDFLRKA